MNGAGLRQKIFVFRFKVYLAALYLESPSSNAEEIIESEQWKHVSLYFLRDVSAKVIREAWNRQFELSCPPECESLRPKLAQLNSHIVDMRKSDHMAFTILPDSLEIEIGGKRVGDIAGGDVGRLILKSWLGKRPADENLKQRLLGKEE